jgi:hypothetical protein
MEIGRRMPELLNEFWNANSALKDARARFDESAPLPPKWRKRANDAKRLLGRPMFKIVSGPPAPFVAAPVEVSTSHAYETLLSAFLRLEEGEVTRKVLYQVSERFQWKLICAARDCGLYDALTCFRKAGHELRRSLRRPSILSRRRALESWRKRSMARSKPKTTESARNSPPVWPQAYSRLRVHMAI